MSRDPIRLTPEILKALRKRVYDTTQIRMSDMCGVSYSYYRAFETGSLSMPLHIEKQIRLNLGLTNQKLGRVRKMIENPLGDEQE